MSKRLYFTIMGALILGCAYAYSQNPSREQTAGIYYAYPGPQGVQAAAPDGFTPFYITHYGRHGSRWITDDYRYMLVKSPLDSLHALGLLTPVGDDVRLRVHRIADDAVGRSGALSPIGEKQHRGIAERMHASFPEVFADSAKINCASSTSLRCAMSMLNFTERLKELNPSLQISRSACDRDMEYIAYTSPEGKAFSAKTAPWWGQHQEYVDSIVDPTRLISSLVTAPDALSPSQQFHLMMGLYWIASDMQDVELDETLYDIFTYDELNAIWRTINARMYACNGDAPINNGVMKHCADNLLRDIIASADAAIIDGQPAATLRFGHDTHLLRLLALMQIEEAAARIEEMEDYWMEWQDYKLSPMAANLQMVFFRNDDGEIIVKIMLNENDAFLPIDCDTAPFYPWEMVQMHLLNQLD